jgi:hypothetical protein
MLWFIVNFVVAFATGDGQLLVWPENAEKKEDVKYVLQLKGQEEVRYWTNRFAKAKAEGANGLKVKAGFKVGDTGYPNKKAFTTKAGRFVGVGEQMTYFVEFTSGFTAEDVENWVKGEGRMSALPTDAQTDRISAIPSDHPF